ncbi:MAG: hypothetical protein H0X33_09260 [Taibaiella sp.]|nr:hypothetical protein [Taibaiella sp.]
MKVTGLRTWLALLLLLIGGNAFCKEGDDYLEKITQYSGIKDGAATPDNISSIFGSPTLIEGSRKEVWYYHDDAMKMRVYWNKASQMEKLVFSSTGTEKPVWNNDKGKCLKEGKSQIAQVIKTLGTPMDMTIKGANQQMHYAFKEYTLNLFFRHGTLVNYSFF